MKTYDVTKYIYKGSSWKDVEVQLLGTLPEEDVKRLLKGYKKEEELDGMWFSPKGTMAYEIKEEK